MHATPKAPTKLTAEKLGRVEAVQKKLLEAARDVDLLAQEEENGWQPGTPQSNKTARARPLADLARRLEEDVVLIERLYS